MPPSVRVAEKTPQRGCAGATAWSMPESAESLCFRCHGSEGKGPPQTGDEDPADNRALSTLARGAPGTATRPLVQETLSSAARTLRASVSENLPRL